MLCVRREKELGALLEGKRAHRVGRRAARIVVGVTAGIATFALLMSVFDRADPPDGSSSSGGAAGDASDSRATR